MEGCAASRWRGRLPRTVKAVQEPAEVRQFLAVMSRGSLGRLGMMVAGRFCRPVAPHLYLTRTPAHAITSFMRGISNRVYCATSLDRTL